jgi:ribonuclease VapC
LAAEHLLDASALLALVLEEAGSDVVAQSLKEARISAVNYTEALLKLVRMGSDYAASRRLLDSLRLTILPFDSSSIASAVSCAPIRRSPLSFGDRACLGTALLGSYTALTAERRWARFASKQLKIQLIR